MNDRFLFRGRGIDDGCGYEGKWYEGFLKISPHGHSSITYWHDNYGWMSITADRKTVGQCTGLKDRNGKLIFEGDILRIPAKDEYEKTTFNSFEVFYHDNNATPTDCGLVLGRLKTHGNSAGGYCGYKLIPENVGKMEIIGNIHEVKE